MSTLPFKKIFKQLKLNIAAFTNGRRMKYSSLKVSEAVFVNVYGAKESIPLAYVARRANTTNRVFVPARQAGNRFLGTFKGLQMRFPAWRPSTTTLFFVPARRAKLAGGIDSLAP
jgi:hypothetical protein